MELHFLKTIWSDIIILKSGEEVAMIDTGFEKQYNEIKTYLNKMNVKKISFILLTHFHRDHYGSLPYILKDFIVEKVYFKSYSALDGKTAIGTIATDEYRKEEYNKYLEMKKIIKEKSNLLEVENINTIEFSNFTLNLFNNRNSIVEIYNDSKYKDSFHKILFSENQNSLVAFMKVNGVNILFGGDIFDNKSIHPKADYVNYQIAKTINEKIDIYKVPHHGTVGCNTEKTLNIYQPKIAIITNGEEYLKNESTIYDDLMKANKNVKFLLTEKHNIIINISNNGTINYEEQDLI